MYNRIECLVRARDLLKSAGVPNNRDEEFLLRRVLGESCRYANELSEEQYHTFMDLIRRRAAREPMDSILGNTEFLGIEVPFSNKTLSPRQETEIMVDAIIRENSTKRGIKVLDMCCGSGCIGVAIAKHLGADVTLCDISPDAVAESERLAKENNVDVVVMRGDLFSEIADQYDIIVSNPPYIESGDIDTLEPEVLNYDPKLALDGGRDGLDFYRIIAKDGYKHLKSGGVIYLELGEGQADKLFEIMSDSHFVNIEIFKDYSGIDRYLKARK